MAIVGNCCREKFGCCSSPGLCSISTALNCYVRDSIHGIQNKLSIIAVVQRLSGDQG